MPCQPLPPPHFPHADVFLPSSPQRKLPACQQQELAQGKAALRQARCGRSSACSGACSSPPSSPVSPVSESESDRGGCGTSDGGSASGHSSPASPLSPRIGVAYVVA